MHDKIYDGKHHQSTATRVRKHYDRAAQELQQVRISLIGSEILLRVMDLLSWLSHFSAPSLKLRSDGFRCEKMRLIAVVSLAKSMRG